MRKGFSRFTRIQQKLNGEEKNFRSQPKFSVTVKVLCVILCTAGCLYNAYQITSSYLAYGVAAEAWFYSTEPLIPPVMTLCMQHNYRDGFKNPEGYNTSSQFFAQRNGFADFVTEILITTNPTGRSPISDISHFANNYVSTFAMHGWICYKINITFYNDTQLTYPMSFAKTLSYKAMIKTELNTNCHSSDVCEVQLAESHNFHQEGIGVILRGGADNYIYYTHQELRLLQAPYVTRCRDYLQEGFSGQEDCFYKCLSTKVFKEFGRVSWRTMVLNTENITFLKDSTPLWISITCE